MRKITQLSVCLFLLATTIKTNAQVSTFKMNDYKYRTKGMRAIGLNLGSSSLLNAGQASNLTFSLAPGTAFNKQYSLDNKQLSFWNWSNLSLAKNGVADMPFLWNLNSKVNWNKRMYKGNNFLQFGSESQLGVNRNTNPMDSNTTVIFIADFNPTVGIGQGRLEYISNAQMALFILEDLKEAGKIKGTVSPEVTYKFTELITQLYNTRVFDFRKRRNYEVAKIDSFLRQNKVISSTDVATYNILADNWNYAIQPQAIEYSNNFSSGTTGILGGMPLTNFTSVSDRININGIFGQAARYAGIRKTLMLNIPSNASNNSGDLGFQNPLDSSAKAKSRINTVLGANISALWENHSALSLHVQRIISFWASAGSVTNTFTSKYEGRADSVTKTKNTTISLGASYNYSLFPNSRTVLSTITSAVISNNSGATVVNLMPVQPGTGIVISSALNANYFINFRSRISGNAGISINSIAGSTMLNFNFSLNYINYLF